MLVLKSYQDEILLVVSPDQAIFFDDMLHKLERDTNQKLGLHLMVVGDCSVDRRGKLSSDPTWEDLVKSGLSDSELRFIILYMNDLKTPICFGKEEAQEARRLSDYKKDWSSRIRPNPKMDKENIDLLRGVLKTWDAVPESLEAKIPAKLHSDFFEVLESLKENNKIEYKSPVLGQLIEKLLTQVL